MVEQPHLHVKIRLLRLNQPPNGLFTPSPLTPPLPYPDPNPRQYNRLPYKHQRFVKYSVLHCMLYFCKLHFCDLLL